MGVSGTGKTTVGELLAERLGGAFLDADDFHTTTNVNKMSRGEPLNDSDRQPWLDAVARAVREHAEPCPLVLACSALKDDYRARLQLGRSPIVLLTGPRETIRQRLRSRLGHFMPGRLLDSQLENLEEPNEAITVSITNTPDEIVDEIVRVLR